MEPYVNEMHTHIGDSDSKSIKGKRVAENLIYSVRREAEGQASSRGGFNREIYRQRRPNTTENTLPEPKIRKKNPTYCSLEPLANFPQEDKEEIMKDRFKWKRYQQLSTEGPRFTSFSYKCTHPGCTMRMHTERVSLHPDKIMVSYEGAHNHSDIQASPGKLSCIPVSQNYEVSEDIVFQGLQSTSVHIVKLDQYIEHLKPNYGIFLKQPSKIMYGVLDDHVAECTSSQRVYVEPHQAFYAVNNACHAPLCSNNIHNPYHSQLPHNHSIHGHFSTAEPSTTMDGETSFQCNLMQRNHNAGYHKPLTCEQPSSSWMAVGGYRNSRVMDDAEQLEWIHPSYALLNGYLTENYNV